MEKVLSKQNQKVVVHRIPDELVYETLNGKPVYYRNYKEVIKQTKQIEDIMGSSSLQSAIVECLLLFIHDNISRSKYKILSNELGIHLNKNDNISADIAIFDKDKLLQTKILDKYIDIAPKLIIEIDTKADLMDFDSVMDYYTLKTNKLFKFGVEKIIWILTSNHHIIEATPHQPWYIKKWNNNIELIDNLNFNLEQLLKDDGIWDLIEKPKYEIEDENIE